MKILDANMILRFLMRDHEEMAERVGKILRTETVIILPEVLAEVLYVMTGVYQIERSRAADTIHVFLHLSAIDSQNKAVLCSAVQLYGKCSLDFVDCLLCAYQKELNAEIYTFDKKLNKMLQRIAANSELL